MSTATPNKKLINLIRGWPAPKSLPAEQLKAAAAKVLSDPTLFIPALQYGPDPGYQPLRQELAKYLSRFFAVPEDPDRICITGGASQSVACILQSFTDPVYTKAIWAVAPVYHLMCPILMDSGFSGRLRAVPEDDGGIDLEWLEKGLESFATTDPGQPQYKDPRPHRKAYRHIIYCVPTSSNPSGKTMTLPHREKLVHLARAHDALVICDDVYDFLQWPILTNPESSSPLPPISPLPRLVDIDLALPHAASPFFGHAISNGSFSKIVGPGVRTGWVEGSPAFVFGLAQTGSTKSGGAPSQIAAAVVCEMMRTGELERHIQKTVRPALQRRHAALLKAVRENLGDFVEEVEESSVKGEGWFGGYFVWLTLRNGMDAGEVAARAKEEENLTVAAGSMFQVKGDEESAKFDNNIRLCFAWEDEENIVEGVERLGRVLRSRAGGEVTSTFRGDLYT